MHPDDYVGWLALALTPGLGARTAGKLLLEFGSPDAIFNASLTTLEGQRLPAAVAQAIHSRQPLSDAAKELAQVQAAGCRLLTWDEPEYPARLREIYDPPPLLYVLGNIELLSRHVISVVGARRPTPYGNQMAERLAKDLADRGLVIASGLARGIDASAHKGALASPRGRRLASWAAASTWSTRRRTRRFSRKSSSAARLSASSRWGRFPRRRISRFATASSPGWRWEWWWWKAAQYSGSLITARLAMEFGREVFGVPGNATQPSSFGPNQLIKQGAKLVTGWEDVVEELPTPVRAELMPVEIVLTARSGPRWSRRVSARREASIRTS